MNSAKHTGNEGFARGASVPAQVGRCLGDLAREASSGSNRVITPRFDRSRPREFPLDVELLRCVLVRSKRSAFRVAIPVWNLYAMNKRRGYIAPPVTAPADVTASAETWTATYSVRNLEDTPITLSQRVTEFLFCDPSVEPQRTAWESQAVTLSGQSSASLNFNIPKSQLPVGVCAISVHWLGMSSSSLPVNAHAYFSIPGARHGVEISDAAFNAAFTRLVNSGEIADPDNLTGEQLYILVRQGKLPKPQLTETTYGSSRICVGVKSGFCV